MCRVLIKNENFDTRDFTIFISQKKWVRNILRPLLELCAREDSALAMNCCSLALILIKKMSDKTMKLIDKFYKKKKKSKAVAVEGGKDAEDGEGAASKKAVTLHDSQSEDESSPAKIQNAKEQVAALLSFKEALCSGKRRDGLCHRTVVVTKRVVYRAMQPSHHQRIPRVLAPRAANDQRREQAGRGAVHLVLPPDLVDRAAQGVVIPQ